MENRVNNIKTEEVMPRIAMMLAIFGIICNILVLTIDGAPLSVAFGIMSIACAITTKKEDNTYPKKSRTAIIIAVIALIIGILTFAGMLMSYKLLSDPETSKIMTEQMKEMIGQMPKNVQEMMKPYLQ